MTPERSSLRSFATMAGVTDKAVRKAITSGRLRECVGRDDAGRPFIRDVALGLQEWIDNAGKSSRKSAQASAQGSASVAEANSGGAGSDSDGTTLISAQTLNEAQRLATLERARKLRLDNDIRRGRVIDVDRAAKEAFEAERVIREALLNLPSRISGELAAETDPGRMYLLLDKAIREALSSTADALLAVTQ